MVALAQAELVAAVSAAKHIGYMTVQKLDWEQYACFESTTAVCCSQLCQQRSVVRGPPGFVGNGPIRVFHKELVTALEHLVQHNMYVQNLPFWGHH